MKSGYTPVFVEKFTDANSPGSLLPEQFYLQDAATLTSQQKSLVERVEGTSKAPTHKEKALSLLPKLLKETEAKTETKQKLKRKERKQ